MGLSSDLKKTVFDAVVEAYKLRETHPQITTFEQLSALFEKDPPASPFSLTIQNQKYAHKLPNGGQEDWRMIASRVVTNVMAAVNAPSELVNRIIAMIVEKKFIAGGRYLYATGRPFHQTQNCLLLRADDSREGWAELLYKATMALMTGAGIGVVYSDVRPRGSIIKRTGGEATGPCSLANIVNEDGRGVMQGGARRSAIWAGLHWWHRDIFEFIKLKNWSPEVAALKAKDFNFPAPFDMTNISVILDDEFFEAIEDEKHPRHELAHSVYWTVIEQMLRTGEPGFSIDVKENAGENLRNACTEITSHDDSDICNLGSINLARITSLEEMSEVTWLSTAFLLAGTCYSDIPYPKVHDVRSKNRRLGLGLMGIHEFLLLNGKRYGADPLLTEYLEVYRSISDASAAYHAGKWGISRPIKVRAIAPNGTIGIIAMTTTSGEPIFCVAYKRRYLKGSVWVYQYVVDPTALRLILMGVDPDLIEDAYDLAADVERRVAFQSYLQQYVDHAISSTINLPAYGTEYNNKNTVRPFGQMLLKYLPTLRGITCYPDGARGGQPLTPVKLKTALSHLGRVFVEGGDAEPDMKPAPTIIEDGAADPVLAKLSEVYNKVKRGDYPVVMVDVDEPRYIDLNIYIDPPQPPELTDAEVMTQQVDVCDISGKGGTCAS